MKPTSQMNGLCGNTILIALKCHQNPGIHVVRDLTSRVGKAEWKTVPGLSVPTCFVVPRAPLTLDHDFSSITQVHIVLVKVLLVTVTTDTKFLSFS